MSDDLVADARHESDPDTARQYARLAGVGAARAAMPGACPFGEHELVLAEAWAEGVRMALSARLRAAGQGSARTAPGGYVQPIHRAVVDAVDHRRRCGKRRAGRRRRMGRVVAAR